MPRLSLAGGGARIGQALAHRYRPDRMQLDLAHRYPDRLFGPARRGRGARDPARRCREQGDLAEKPDPPYLPKHLLLFGRGFLPNAREIELPMGKVPAQAYAYAGPDDLVAVENAARRVMLADFPEYALPRHFAFHWGSQRSASGNEMYSIGIYELRACPK